jgi:RNA 2',3'-cyclic 3'-phosphodiesterase
MARIRIFLSVDVGAKARSRVLDLQASLGETLPGVKWVDEASLHVTLLFLGEVNELDLVPICRIAKEVGKKLPPFAMEVGGVGCFPNPRRPKVLWVGITEGADHLCRLHESLEAPLMESGCYRREERAYTPHLTLGRVSGEDESADWGAILRENESWHGGAIAVGEILVMSSELRRDAPVYSVIGRAPLTGKPWRKHDAE